MGFMGFLGCAALAARRRLACKSDSRGAVIGFKMPPAHSPGVAGQCLRRQPDVHEPLARHCEELARTYQMASGENVAMAGLHRDIARQVKRQ